MQGYATAIGEFFGVMTSGFETFAPGLGGGLNAFAENVFFKVGAEGAVEGLSSYGYLMASVLAISLTMSVGYLIFNLIRA